PALNARTRKPWQGWIDSVRVGCVFQVIYGKKLVIRESSGFFRLPVANSTSLSSAGSLLLGKMSEGGYFDGGPGSRVPIPLRGVALSLQRVDQPVHRVEEAHETQRGAVPAQFLPVPPDSFIGAIQAEEQELPQCLHDLGRVLSDGIRGIAGPRGDRQR